MELVKINNIDFTKNVNETSYVVNSNQEYIEWTDANFRIHRKPCRNRIEGKFDLCFVTEVEYDSFIDNVEAASDGRLLRITLYVGGDVNDNVTTDVYYTIESVKTGEINENYIFNKVTMSVKEW